MEALKGIKPGGLAFMFVMGNLFGALADVLSILLTALSWLIIARALLSWVNPDPYNFIVQFIERSTEPFLAPLRPLVGAHRWGIDFSPFLALLLIYFLRSFLVSTLIHLSLRLQ